MQAVFSDSKIRQDSVEKWCGGNAACVGILPGLKEDPLKHWRVAANLVLVVILGQVGCSNPSSQPAPQQGAANSPAPQATPAPPSNASAPAKGTVWKSETTGKEYRVWTDKDQLHAEWANIPPEFAARGAYIRSLGERKGEKWVGQSETNLPCLVGEGQQAHIANFCQLTAGFEIDSMSATKIEGRGEYKRISDCAKCQVILKEWKPFVWVPKK